MILILLQGTIMLYDGLFSTPADYCVGPDCTASYSAEAFDSNQTKIWAFVTNPTTWKNSVFLGLLAGLGLTAAAYILIGSFVRTPSDTAFFSPVFAIILASGFIPLASLYYVITRDVGIFGCEIGSFCLLATLTWVFTGGILSIFFVLAAIENWRTGTF